MRIKLELAWKAVGLEEVVVAQARHQRRPTCVPDKTQIVKGGLACDKVVDEEKGHLGVEPRGLRITDQLAGVGYLSLRHRFRDTSHSAAC